MAKNTQPEQAGTAGTNLGPEMSVVDARYLWLGIPAIEQPPSHYRLLGIVPFEQSADVIAAAADRQMAHIRTYQGGKNSIISQTILSEIAAAKLCLLSRTKKSSYDTTLRSQARELDKKSEPSIRQVPVTARAPSSPSQRPGSANCDQAPSDFSGRRELARQARSFVPKFWTAVASVLLAIAIAIAFTASFHGRAQRQATGVKQASLSTGEQTQPKNAFAKPLALGGTSSPNISSDRKPNGPGRPESEGDSADGVHTGNAFFAGPVGGRRSSAFGHDNLSEAPPANAQFNNNGGFGIAGGPQSAPGIARSKAGDAADTIDRVMQSVVRITVASDNAKALGSGFVADADGAIVTNFHVVDGARSAEVEFRDGSTASVAGYLVVDPKRDVAVLQLDTSRKMRLLPLTLESRLPRQGDHVYAIGAPRGLGFTVSEGIVSAVRNGAEIEDYFPDYERQMTWIQTTAPISPGNSGGPLISVAGNVLGINTWSKTNGQNLNFAVSAVEITTVLRNREFTVQPLSRLPAQEPAAKYVNTERISLPSGRFLDIGSIFANTLRERLRANQFFSKSQLVAKLDFDSGAPYCLASVDHGILHGPVLASYEGGQPATVAEYVEGRRHGNLMTWSEQGRRILFAQYSNGKKNGFFCLFDESNQLCFVQEYRANVLESSHLIKNGAITNNLGPGEVPSRNEAFSAAMKLFDQSITNLNENERKIKKLVAEWDEKRRRAVAAANSAAARQEIIDHGNAIRSSNAAAIQGLRQLSGLSP
jgi:hypothetical protein